MLVIVTTDKQKKLQTHFKGAEMACKDGAKEYMYAPELMRILESIREHFNKPVIINSGYRTPEWNAKVGGAKNSYHMKGMAADIVVKGVNPKQVAEYASVIMQNGGVIGYKNFTHIDVRSKKYRKGV